MASKRWSSICLILFFIAFVELSARELDSAETCFEGYRQDASSGLCVPMNDDDEEGRLDSMDDTGHYFVIEEEDKDDREYMTMDEFQHKLKQIEHQNELQEYDQMETMETVEQEVPGDPHEATSVLRVIEQMNLYLESNMTQPEWIKLRDLCINKHKTCAFWTSIGECEKNPDYMKIDCALACQSCEQLDVKYRCKLDPDAVDIWQPGDLNKMFHRIAYGPDSATRKVQVLSDPSFENKTGKDYGPLPWVVIIDDFITEMECKRLIELGAERGYERSRDVGEEQPDGTFSSVESLERTSTNAWCQDECQEDKMVQDVIKKIETLTGIPDSHSEHLQLLKYEETQFYGTHHDLIEYQIDRQCGPRIITAFLYLNDVEAGGGTNFPELNLTVMPKQGRILLWPSVLDNDFNTRDEWTHHQALPVEKGVKYGANGWLHLRDFKTPHSIDCA